MSYDAYVIIPGKSILISRHQAPCCKDTGWNSTHSSSRTQGNAQRAGRILFILDDLGSVCVHHGKIKVNKNTNNHLSSSPCRPVNYVLGLGYNRVVIVIVDIRHAEARVANAYALTIFRRAAEEAALNPVLNYAVCSLKQVGYDNHPFPLLVLGAPDVILKQNPLRRAVS